MFWSGKFFMQAKDYTIDDFNGKICKTEKSRRGKEKESILFQSREKS